MPDYSKEELWELYENIPKDLQNTVFSEKTANVIYNTCNKNGIKDDKKISQVAKYTGYVLLGLVPPGKLRKTLEKEMKITKSAAQKISQEINRIVFLPIKQSLEDLYQVKIKPGLRKKSSMPLGKKLVKKDKYRENIE